MPLVDELKQRARRLQAETFALVLAARHPGTPWYAKAFAAAVVAYALSPIDLIPDFIPVLGLLDDLILVPLGLAAAVRMIPAAVLDECRVRARDSMAARGPASRIAAAVIVCIWILLAVLCGRWAYDAFLREG